MNLNTIITAVLSGLTINFSLAVGGLTSPGVALAVEDVEVAGEPVYPAMHLFGEKILAIDKSSFEWFYPVKLGKTYKRSKYKPTNEWVYTYELYWQQYINDLKKKREVVKVINAIPIMSNADVGKVLERGRNLFALDYVSVRQLPDDLQRELLSYVCYNQYRFVESELQLLETWLKMYISYFSVYDKNTDDVMTAIQDQFDVELNYRLEKLAEGYKPMVGVVE